MSSSERFSAPAASASDWPIGKFPAWVALGITFSLGLFDFLDRQILAALFPFLKAEWQLTDTQLGGLVSIVNVSIAVLVLPVGLLIDRWSRTKTLGGMALVWTVATGACAFAGHYGHLLIARFFVGAGEAGYTPASSALLAATFPQRMRTRVLAISNMGAALGAPLGLIIGAYVASRWGWRYAFGLVALPGLIPAFAAFFLRDYKTVELKDGKDCPPPDMPEASDCIPPQRLSIPRSLLLLLTTPTLMMAYIGSALFMFNSSVLMNWLPSYFNRVGGLPITSAGGFSAMLLLCSTASMFLLSFPADWLRRRNQNAAIIMVGICLGIGFAAQMAAFVWMQPGGAMQIGSLMFFYLVTGGCSPLITVTIMDVTHPGLRATAIGLQLIIINICGLGLGPLVAGMLSDHFGLGTALTLLSVAPLLAASFCITALRTYRRDRERASEGAVQF